MMLSWFNSRPGERRIAWTVGLTGGYSTFLGLDIEARRAVLTNPGLNNVDYLPGGNSISHQRSGPALALARIGQPYARATNEELTRINRR